MKKLLFYALLILTFNVQAQTTYTVLKVEPKDGVKANGNMVKAGDKINANSQIKLANSSAYLRVFNGRESATVKQSGLLSAVIEAPRIVATTAYAATKAVIANKADLIALLQTQNLLIIDSLQISIPKSMYALQEWKEEPEGKFFFVTYQYQGKETNKFLQNLSNNTFVLDENIFSVAGRRIDKSQIQNMEIRYAVNAETDEPLTQKLSFVFLSSAELKGEIKAYIEASSEQDKEKLFTEILRYLHQYYGTPERESLKAWLKRNFEGRF